MPRRIDWRSVKTHRSYEVAELAALVGVCRGTVRNWIKSGLPALDERRPILIVGDEFRRWFRQSRNARKRKCGPGEMFCLKCREPRAPALAMVDFIPRNDNAGNLSGLCAACETPMYRACCIADIEHVMPGIDVSIQGGESDTNR